MSDLGENPTLREPSEKLISAVTFVLFNKYTMTRSGARELAIDVLNAIDGARELVVPSPQPDDGYRPHKFPEGAPDEVLAWRCAACGEWIDQDFTGTECPIDWRRAVSSLTPNETDQTP